MDGLSGSAVGGRRLSRQQSTGPELTPACAHDLIRLPPRASVSLQTFLNGARVKAKDAVELHHGDTLRFGADAEVVKKGA